MPSYDGVIFRPPAPLASVALRDPSSGRTASGVPMLIDSGADVTLLPRPSLEALGLDLDAGGQYELTAFDGTASIARAVYMHLTFLRRTFRGQFLLIDQECGILGRDVVNHLSILLNGPALEWNEANR
jgi:hypothetical protein